MSRAVLALVVATACNREQPRESPPAPLSPPPSLEADPVGATGEPLHGDADLPFTITKVIEKQERQLSPPFYTDRHLDEAPWTYVEATLGGGTFGWLVKEGNVFNRILLVPTTSSARVASAFTDRFQVYLPPPKAGEPPRPFEVPVTIISRANGWITTTWRCQTAEVYVQFNLDERRGRFVQKNRRGTFAWGSCLASILR